MNSLPVTSVVGACPHDCPDTCALLTTGSVQCWGDNSRGQLGNNSTANSPIPVLVNGISNATAIAAGAYHTCAQLANQTVLCWGYNAAGQLGDNTLTNSSVPVAVSNITNATAIAAGQLHVCALLTNGTVQCWGRNARGQLGNGKAGLTPQTVLGPFDQYVGLLSPSSLVDGFATPASTFGGDSGNPVVLASATPAVCTVNGSTVTANTLGTCTLTVTQAGSVDYAPGSYSLPYVVQTGVPQPPTSVTIISSDTSMRVMFGLPTSDGGLSINEYVATCTGGGSTFTARGLTSPLVVSGLTKGVSYTCSVTAHNSLGYSAATASITKVARAFSIAPILSILLD